MIRTYARAADLSLAGEMRGWNKLEVTIRYKEVGSWAITGPASGSVPRLITPGAGLIVIDSRGVPLLSDNGVLISGDVEEIGPRTWSADGQDAHPGTLAVSGGDDLAIVADELAYPDPTETATSQAAFTYDFRSGIAETVIKAYVDANIGTGRATARGDAAVPNARLVTVASDLARGSTVSFKARFDPLMDVVRTLGDASTPLLAPTVRQSGTDLVFDVAAPTDRSESVVFSQARRNLRGYSITQSAPTATHVVVAGDGTGTGRAFRERSDTTAAQEWHRIIRTFVDQRQTSVAAELDAAGDEELAKARRSGVLSATAVDTPRMRFGEHFSLGDYVSVEVEAGTAFTDQVTAAKFTVTEQGVQPTEITIGSPDLDPHTPEAYKRVAQALAQISALQRRY